MAAGAPGTAKGMNQHKRDEEPDRRRDDAQEAVDADEERGRSRPFDYPHEERKAGVRATRRISREEADADITPGVPGGQGSTGGGQPGGTGVGVPPGGERINPDEAAETVGWADTGEEGDVRDDPDRRGER
jgi:hypothetical protein